MSNFPLEPQLSKMLLSAQDYNCTNEILSIVALLSAPLVFVRPKEKRAAADAVHAQFAHREGDHLTLLNVYHAYKQAENPNTFCFQNYLNMRSLKNADNVRTQLAKLMLKLNLKLTSPSMDNMNFYYTCIRKALVTGFFMQVAYASGKRYLTIKENQVVSLHPSTCIDHKPQWMLYHEFVLTSANFIRTVTEIRPEWLVEIAPNFYAPSNFTKTPEIRKLLLRLLDQQKQKK